MGDVAPRLPALPEAEALYREHFAFVWRNANNPWFQLALDDAGHFFIDPPSGSYQFILQGSLAVGADPTPLAWERVFDGQSGLWKAWTLSSVGVFVADSTGLYLTSTASP